MKFWESSHYFETCTSITTKGNIFVMLGSKYLNPTHCIRFAMKNTPDVNLSICRSLCIAGIDRTYQTLSLPRSAPVNVKCIMDIWRPQNATPVIGNFHYIKQSLVLALQCPLWINVHPYSINESPQLATHVDIHHSLVSKYPIQPTYTPTGSIHVDYRRAVTSTHPSQQNFVHPLFPLSSPPHPDKPIEIYPTLWRNRPPAIMPVVFTVNSDDL